MSTTSITNHESKLSEPSPFFDEATMRFVQTIFADHLNLSDDGEFEAGPTFTFPGMPTYTMALPDLSFGWHGPSCIEVNVPNGAGSSADGADWPRVRHEVDTLLSRCTPRPGTVQLRCMSPDTTSVPEILIRAGIYAGHLQRTTGIRTATIEATRGVPRADAINIIHGSIPAIADHLTIRSDGTLLWKGMHVEMIFNPNVLGELARRTGRTLRDILDSVDPGLTHEGTWLSRIGFDKPMQQDLFAGTGIRPLVHRSASNIKEAVQIAVEMARLYDGAIIKPNAASGGALVHPVDPRHDEARVYADLGPALQRMSDKYGPGWEATCPLHVYEFLKIRPAMLNGRPHRWDLRFAVLVRPSGVEITPLFARICPAPIGNELTRADGVCNFTGRENGEAKAVSPAQLCELVGLSTADLELGAAGLYEWMQNAYRTR